MLCESLHDFFWPLLQLPLNHSGIPLEGKLTPSHQTLAHQLLTLFPLVFSIFILREAPGLHRRHER